MSPLIPSNNPVITAPPNYNLHLSQPTSCKEDTDVRMSSLGEMEETIYHARRNLATKMLDAFIVMDSMTDKEFMTVILTLGTDGVSIADMLEKFRRYKSSDNKPKHKQKNKPSNKQ